ncbi:MAG TPA: autotransporter-associated beta strand repeat-containing protein, partial [Gemmataceae bacterium]|nr:autotransporter-associated beta strand repeat-containing protein [Gemmataceae bacterium]
MLPQWVRTWWKRYRCRTSPSQKPRRRRPSLQLGRLEDRLVPTVHIWTGAVSSLWSAGGNWTGGAPTVGEANVVLDFPVSPAGNLANVDNISGNLAINQINIVGTGYSFGAVSGSSITLKGGAASPTVSDTLGGNSFNASLPIALGGSSDSTIQVLAGTDTVNSTLSGGNGLALSGGGTLLLGAANTYGGNTTVSAGTLQNNVAKALPSATSLTVDAGATYDLNGHNQALASLALSGGTVLTEAATLTLNGDVTATGASSITGTDPGVDKDNVDLPADRTFTIGTTLSTDALNIAAVLGGSGGLDKVGPGTLDLTSANTYSGATTVGAGTLLVDGSVTGTGAVAVNSGTLGGTGFLAGTVTVNTGGAITGGTLGGIGTLTVGALTFNGGTYAADFNGDTSDRIDTAGAVNLNAGTAGTFTVNSQSGTTTAANVFTLIQNTGVGGISNTPFLGATEGSSGTIDGTAGAFTYAGGAGQNLTFTATGAPSFTLPAPGSYTLKQVTEAGGSDNLQLLQGSTIIDSRPSSSVTGTYTVKGASNGVYSLTVDYTASGGYFQ